MTEPLNNATQARLDGAKAQLAAAKAQLEATGLSFAQSQSKPVGVHGRFIEMMRDNSVRIVGSMKLVGDVFVGFSGNPFLIGYSVFSGIGRLIMIGYGTKANQKKAAAAKEAAPLTQRSIISKILHPKEYPVESAAGASIIGEASAGGYGVERIMDYASNGWPLFLCEVFAVYSYSNLLFGKEKKKEAIEPSSASLVFAKSQSKPVGWYGALRQKMKENPVLVSSMMNIAIGAVMMYFGAGVPYFIGASIITAANLVQALLVKKKEFNIEGALEEKMHTQQRAASGLSATDHAPVSAIHTDSLHAARLQPEPPLHLRAAHG